MSNTDEKLIIIDEIATKHPSYGVDKGWSYYVGGMKDSGDWYFRKMLDVPIEELLSFLTDINTEESKAKIPKEYTEEEKKDMQIFNSVGDVIFTEYYRKQLQKLHSDIELKMFFGEK